MCGTAADTGHLFNRGLGLGNRARWMRPKMCFQGVLMRMEGAGRSGFMRGFQSIKTVALMAPQTGEHGLPTHATETGNLLMGQSLTFQIDDFHPFLNIGRRMMVTLIV